MEKRWTLKEQGDAAAVENLSRELNISPLLCNLLVQRGITTFEAARRFFRPSTDDLHDPFLMKDMDKAVERIRRAIAGNEKILVYGDYDVDGTTAVALVYSWLRERYGNAGYYIPDRYAEGYGISDASIDRAHENGISLIIALDCGIKAVKKIARAAGLGIDFIVCDHHRPGSELPPAVAVLDPKRDDCTYPFKELPGCGIGFKLVQALSAGNAAAEQDLEQYLDLAAVAVCSDIVPLTGENRILTHFGLKRLNENPRPGFRALLELAEFKREIKVNDVVFVIGPRINAAGRMESGRKAVELLIAGGGEDTRSVAELIQGHNTGRRDVDAAITQEALRMIGGDEVLVRRKTTVLFSETWHKGVIGIVASRLTEKYYRPTILLTQSNGKATGSARSVKGFDIYNAIEACSDLVEQFGGHMYAAGLTIALEKIAAFQQRFEEVVSSTIDERLLIPEVEIDAEIGPGDINPKMHAILEQFGPFGPGNMAPVFVTHNVLDKGYARTVGKMNEHLKMDLLPAGGSAGDSFSAIAFGQGGKLGLVKSRTPFSVCYAVEENVWNGKVSLQLNVKDIKVPTD